MKDRLTLILLLVACVLSVLVVLVPREYWGF